MINMLIGVFIGLVFLAIFTVTPIIALRTAYPSYQNEDQDPDEVSSGGRLIGVIIVFLVALMALATFAWAAYMLPLGKFSLLMLSVSPLLVTAAVFARKMFQA